MVDFAELKRRRGSKSLKDVLTGIEKTASNERQKDERFWTPTVDKSGNGTAVIRFLPARADEDGFEFVKVNSHSFQGASGQWYIENCLTTLNQNDPVVEKNRILWNSGDEKTVREQKIKKNFYSNILVVRDPGNKENEGKVFLFRYGTKIFEKIERAVKPEFADDEPLNPFDFWEGANFKMKIRKVSNYRNYDLCEFASPSAISDDDDEIKKIWDSQYSLTEFLDPKNFKSYDELKARLETVTMQPGSNPVSNTYDDEKQAQPPKQKYVKEEEDQIPWDDDDDDDKGGINWKSIIEGT